MKLIEIKEEYKKILCGLLALSTAVTLCGCAKKELTGREFADATAKKYTVEEGDTLYDISMKQYGTYDYYDEIADYNGIENSDEIKAGDTIILPQVRNFVYYTVKPGDTLTQICQNRYGRSDNDIVVRLATYNDLKDPDKINASIVLIIPDIETLEKLVPYDYNFGKILK